MSRITDFFQRRRKPPTRPQPAVDVFADEPEMLRNESVVVTVPSRQALYYPQACTCCLGKPDNEIHVSQTNTSYYVVASTSRTLTLRFPICGECLGHAAALSRACAAQVFGACGSSVLFILAFAKATHTPMSNYFVQTEIVGVVFYLMLAHIFPLKPISLRHASTGKPVDLLRFNDQEIVLSFQNPEYGAEFSRVNGASAGRGLSLTTHKDRTYGGSSGCASIVAVLVLNLMLFFFVTLDAGF